MPAARWEECHRMSYDSYCKELAKEVLGLARVVVTTPIGAAKMASRFGGSFAPDMVIFVKASRARELSTLVSLSTFPDAVSVFLGNPEPAKPFVAMSGAETGIICGEQLRISTMERFDRLCPPKVSLLTTHRVYGGLHLLPSSLFFDGRLRTPQHFDAYPKSTRYVLDFLSREVAIGRILTVPRTLVHIRNAVLGSRSKKETSKYNPDRLNWVMSQAKKLMLDPEFRTVEQPNQVNDDGKGRGSILIVTPYSEARRQYRRAIRHLIKSLDRTQGNERIHRQVRIEARTVDTAHGLVADFVFFDLVHHWVTNHVENAQRLCVGLTRAQQGEVIIMHPGMPQSDGFKKW